METVISDPKIVRDAVSGTDQNGLPMKAVISMPIFSVPSIVNQKGYMRQIPNAFGLRLCNTFLTTSLWMICSAINRKSINDPIECMIIGKLKRL